MKRANVEEWVAGYERVWRSPGVEKVAELFTPDATYLPSPWKEPIDGLDAIGRFWDAERDGPDEPFTMRHEVVAFDGDGDGDRDGGTAVLRVEVDYGSGSRWRDLWVIRFGADGRCRAFEEWPFAPAQPDGH